MCKLLGNSLFILLGNNDVRSKRHLAQVFKLEGWVRVFQWEDKRQAVGKNGQFKKDSWTACQRSKVVCQAETLTCGI